MIKAQYNFDLTSFPHIFDLSKAPSAPKEIFSFGETQVFYKDTTLIHYNEIVNHIYYVHKGTILGFRPDRNLEMHLAYVLKEGFIGEGWYFSKLNSMDEIIVAEDTVITKFSQQAINKLINLPQVAILLLYTLSTKSISMTSKFQNFKNSSLKDQLKYFITNQFNLINNKDKNEIELHLSQKDLAVLLNVSSVSISRAFSELKKEMDIKTSKNKVIIRK